jgi:hypothetical protein
MAMVVLKYIVGCKAVAEGGGSRLRLLGFYSGFIASLIWASCLTFLGLNVYPSKADNSLS